MFIVIEGIDNTGKTSLAKLLVKYIKEDLNQNAVYLSNPGGTDFGNDLREVFKNGTNRTKAADCLLLAASQLNLWSAIKDYLDNDIWVVVDRWDTSAHAYQTSEEVGIIKDGLYYNLFTKQAKLMDLPYPDLCIWLDITEEVGLYRHKTRLTDVNETDRYEADTTEEYHKWYTDMRGKYAGIMSYNLCPQNYVEVFNKFYTEWDNESWYRGTIHPIYGIVPYKSILRIPTTDIKQTPQDLLDRVLQVKSNCGKDIFNTDSNQLYLYLPKTKDKGHEKRVQDLVDASNELLDQINHERNNQKNE